MERNSRKLLKLLEADGWRLVRRRGDHHTFKHPRVEKLVTVPHPRKDLPMGLVKSIYKIAGWQD